jgi:hypothetical protein
MRRSEINQPGGGHLLRQIVGRVLRGGVSALAVGMALAASFIPAHAGTNGLTVNITPLVPNIGTQTEPKFAVSYSGTPAALGQTLHSAFNVFVKDDTNANVNTAWLTITTSVNDARPGLPFLTGPNAPPLPSGCQLSSPDNLTLQCVFDSSQLVPGVSFDLVVDNPQALTTSTPDSVLKLESSIQAGQGNSAANPSSIVIKKSPGITFSVDAPAGLRSYVLSNQGFKVDNAGSKTTVTPPVGVPVDLQEAFSQQSCSPMYKKCLLSALSIKNPDGSLFQFGTSSVPGFLQIDLLRDKSTLKPSADIYKAYLLLRYTPDGGSTSVPILVCDPGPAIPSGATRCVTAPNPASATDPTSGTFLDAAGNLHFRVLANTNGIINW